MEGEGTAGKRCVCLFLVVSILIVSSAVSVVGAVTYGEAGVRAGQWAEYTSVSGYGDVFPYVNGTVGYRIEVTGVVGPTVHFNWTELAGDQVHEYQWTANLSCGLFYQYLVYPNLGTGDPLWPGSACTMNGTTTLLVAGVERSVVYIVIRCPDLYEKIWYDVETGLMVKSDTWSKNWNNLTVTSNNMWTSQSPLPEGNLPIVATIILALGSVVVVVLVAWIDVNRRRR